MKSYYALMLAGILTFGCTHHARQSRTVYQEHYTSLKACQEDWGFGTRDCKTFSPAPGANHYPVIGMRPDETPGDWYGPPYYWNESQEAISLEDGGAAREGSKLMREGEKHAVARSKPIDYSGSWPKPKP